MDVILPPPPISVDPQHQLLSSVGCPDRGRAPCGDVFVSAGEACTGYSQGDQAAAKYSDSPHAGLPHFLRDMME